MNIDTRSYPVLVACALIVRDGKVLLERHPPTAEHNEYQWDLPGGKVEICETPADAVVREIREEMDIDIEVVTMLPRLWPSVWTDPDRSKHWILAVYECRILNGEPPLSHDLKWHDIGLLDPKAIKRPDLEIITAWQEWNADDILAAAPLYSDRITNLTTQIAGMKTIGDAMLADYSQSVVALGAAQELSRQNHEAALGFQERAMNAERERGELQAELAAAQGPCKLCQEKSEEIRDALRPAGNGLYLMDPVGAIKLAVKWLVGYHEQLAAIRGPGRPRISNRRIPKAGDAARARPPRGRTARLGFHALGDRLAHGQYR